MRWNAGRQAAGVSERKVHVMLECSGFGGAGSTDGRRGKAPVCTGVSAYRVCRIACKQTVVMMVVVCAGVRVWRT